MTTGDGGGRPPDQDGGSTGEETRQFPVPFRQPQGVAGAADDEGDEGEISRIVDRPPEPEPSPFAEPAPEPPDHARFAAIERRMSGFGDALSRFDERIGALADAHGAEVRAVRTVIAAVEDRMTARVCTAGEEERADLDAARGEMRANDTRLRATVSDVRDEVLSRASRAELDGVSKGLGALGKTVAAFLADLAGLRATDGKHARLLIAMAKRLSGLVATIAAFKERVGAVERANSDIRNTVDEAGYRSQETSDRVDALATTTQTIARDIEALRGTGEGIERTLHEIRETAAAAQATSDANHATMTERLGAVEERLALLGRIVSTRASQEEVRRVNESVAAVRADVETFDVRLQQLRVDSAHNAETLEGLLGKVGGVESRVSGAEHQATALVETDAALRRRMNEIGEEAGGLRIDYDALRLSMDELATFPITFAATFARLSGDLESMRGALSDLTGSVSRVEGAMSADEGRVGRMEERLAVLGEFQGLLERMKGLDEKLVKLEGWRRVFAREAEVYARRLGLSPPPRAVPVDTKAS